jgi:hypothetical protein
MEDKKIWAKGPHARALSRPAIAVLRANPAAKGGREIFNLATIERVAERLFGIAGERPLIGRLRYLRTMDFPGPAPRGRGQKAILGLDEMMQTLFALELMHAGTSATRAIRMVRTDWTTMKAAIAYGWSRENGIGDPERPYCALVFTPSVLDDLGTDDRADEPLHELVGNLTMDKLSQLQMQENPPRRLLIINAQAFALALTSVEEAVLGVSTENFAREMRMFSAEAFGSTKPLKWKV